MNDTKKRYSTALAMAIIVHLALCMLLACLDFPFNRHSSQVLEVTLASSSAQKKGFAKVVQANQPKEQKQIVASQFQKDDILEKKPTNSIPTTSLQSTEVLSNALEDVNRMENGVGSGTSNSYVGKENAETNKQGVPTTPPRVISSYHPNYPTKARNNNIEGVTYVKALVNADGSVGEAFITSSSGNVDLDDAAVKAVAKWHFAAAKDAFGQKVSCYITVPIRFTLK